MAVQALWQFICPGAGQILYLKCVIYPTLVLAKALRACQVFSTVNTLPGITCDEPERPILPAVSKMLENLVCCPHIFVFC